MHGEPRPTAMRPDPDLADGAISRPGRLLPAWPAVLAVVAHPDDETFGLGAVVDRLATGPAGCWSATTPALPAPPTTRPRRAPPCGPAARPGCPFSPGPCPPTSPASCAARPARHSPASHPIASTCASAWTGPGSAGQP